MEPAAVKAVFDTNILVDYLTGVEEARRELSLYKTRLISVISQIEVLMGVSEGEEEETAVRSFLSSFEVKGVTGRIADEAVRIRRATRMKVPDAIVYATAREEGCLVVSRNTKDLKAEWPDVRVPYQIEDSGKIL